MGVAAAVVAVMAVGTVAHAQTAALTPAQLIERVRLTVESAAAKAQDTQAAQLPGLRVSSEIGSLDPTLRLAPCEVAEPYLPAGTRPWGSIRIGLRCTQGPVRWNVFVPAHIRVHAPVATAAAALPTGHVLTAEDIVVQEAELSAEAGAVVTDPSSLIGRPLASSLKPGQAVRAQHVRARQWFAAGEAVTVVARGSGFAISAEGVALSPGLEGQTTRVRLEGGRVVSATAVGQRRVEVLL